MRFFRSERVESLIEKQLGLILEREVEFGGALVTITGVEVDKKLDHAKVLVSVIPSENASKAMIQLEHTAGHLQHLLMKKINIKPMPRIVFELDRGPENAANVEKALLKK